MVGSGNKSEDNTALLSVGGVNEAIMTIWDKVVMLVIFAVRWANCCPCICVLIGKRGGQAERAGSALK